MKLNLSRAYAKACRRVEERRQAGWDEERLAACSRADVLDDFMEVVCGAVLVAERNLQKEHRSWENADLARELLRWGRPLARASASLRERLDQAAERMGEAVCEHPRLELDLLRFRLELAEPGPAEPERARLRERAGLLERNIAFADRGEPERIDQTGTLRHDPVEWTARWEEIIDEADRKVYERLAGVPRGMGFCHAFWHERTRVLAEDYGLYWRSPARMNPRVMFD